VLIIGTYADGVALQSLNASKIADLTAFLDVVAPAHVGIHLLPFYPTSGDGGFAIDDWFSVRSDLGSWTDIEVLASARKLIVDGVYNHVGIGHEWMRRFLASPDLATDMLHAYRTDDATQGPMSPRGQPVLCRYDIAGQAWHVWQTFTDTAVDIRLDNQVVIGAIDQHLRMLSQNGVWGVRLDAVAYYSKFLGGQIRHNPGVYEIANNLAMTIERYGMHVFAQVDSDEDGIRYFRRKSQSHYVINDFTYSAYLALAILTGDPAPLARHLARTASVPKICLRSPRNHDGLLLRSGLLAPLDRQRLIEAAAEYGIGARLSGGVPYELNCSAPFLYAQSNGRHRLSDVIELAVAITGMTHGGLFTGAGE